MEPTDPIAAASHPAPYRYYETLLGGPPLYFDAGIRMWVAAHADSVSEVFADRSCRVRPATEPVPAALDGRPAGALCRHLVRMTDGEDHDRRKRALSQAIAPLPASGALLRSSQTIEQQLPDPGNPAALTAWVYETPVAVVASLLGLPPRERAMIAAEVRDFVAGHSPASSAQQLEAADAAALRLTARLCSVVGSIEADSDHLAARVADSAQRAGWTDRSAMVANLVGLLTQTYEATAGLIGNAIVELATAPQRLDEVRSLADGWRQLVHETSRHESPVQNTRRFVGETTSIGGVDLAPGAAILLVLAAANRDPRVNPEPDRFLLDRPNRCTFTFGRGSHACPGEAVACGIAAFALSALDRRLDKRTLGRLAWTWQPSANGRLPRFHPDDTPRRA